MKEERQADPQVAEKAEEGAKLRKSRMAQVRAEARVEGRVAEVR